MSKLATVFFVLSLAGFATVAMMLGGGMLGVLLRWLTTSNGPPFP